MALCGWRATKTTNVPVMMEQGLEEEGPSLKRFRSWRWEGTTSWGQMAAATRYGCHRRMFFEGELHRGEGPGCVEHFGVPDSGGNRNAMNPRLAVGCNKPTAHRGSVEVVRNHGRVFRSSYRHRNEAYVDGGAPNPKRGDWRVFGNDALKTTSQVRGFEPVSLR